MTIDVPRTAVSAATPASAPAASRPMIEISHVDKIFTTVRNERIHILEHPNYLRLWLK